MKKLKIKKGDTVKIIAGEHKGSEGKIITVLISQNKAIIEGVNLVKKHEKLTRITTLVKYSLKCRPSRGHLEMS